MKLFYVLIILFLNNCSFDNKTGIWKNISKVENEQNVNFKDFKSINITNQNTFNETIKIKKNFKFILNAQENPQDWVDFYYSPNNNYVNFQYKDKNKIFFQSTTLSRKKLSKNILFKNNLLITTNTSGEIIIYSLEKKKIINKYNFYKNKFKHIKKNLNYILNNNTLYLSDNIGYLYAYDILDNKIIWAKKFDIPFRSNLKLTNKELFLADQSNNLFIINILNGETIKKIPTEETLIKNNFINNLTLDDNNLYFLNTFGSLYSINRKNYRINWFVNINPLLDINIDNLFISSELKIAGKNLIISSNNNLRVLNSENGSIRYTVPIQSMISPVINNGYLFIISENNLLISINITTGKIIYSYQIDNAIAQFMKTNIKNKVNVSFLRIVNDQIFIFLENSFVLKFDIFGELKDTFKLPKRINSNLAFINSFMLYVNNKNKLILLN
jgi:outer membrane protein assembly factor BamB